MAVTEGKMDHGPIRVIITVDEEDGMSGALGLDKAGLECGTFKALKPDLDMISIGPDLADVHTIKETLYLNSVPRVWRLLEGILRAE